MYAGRNQCLLFSLLYNLRQTVKVCCVNPMNCLALKKATTTIDESTLLIHDQPVLGTAR